MDQLFKKTQQPVLTARPDLPWANGVVFNPGAWYDDGVVHLLFRAIPRGYRRYQIQADDPMEGGFGFDDYVSAIGYAASRDGISFTCRPEPFIRPDSPFDRYGAEDPRIARLDDRYWITYTALGEPAFARPGAIRIGLASTADFVGLEKHGVVGPTHQDKDAVLFPRRIGGRIAMLHRIAPDIQLVFFEDLDELLDPPPALWERHMARLDDHVVLRPGAGWEEKKVGAGPTPIETDEGWLLLYHGVSSDHVYAGGLALYDLDDPRRLIARSPVPVLVPELDFELHGDVPNVVFPEGAVVMDGTLHVYYGAADQVIGHAAAPLGDVLDFLREAKTPPVNRRVFAPPVASAAPNPGPRTIDVQPPVEITRLHGGTPVLERDAAHPWESRVVLNPAAVCIEAGPVLDQMTAAWGLDAAQRARLDAAGGACVMVYRAQGATDPETRHAPSSLGLAVFTPLLEFVWRRPEPVLRADAPYQNLGVEDARCTRVGDTFYLHYTGYAAVDASNPESARRVRICLATTTDFLHWTQHGPLAGGLNEVDNKNPALFPVPVGGKWLLLHRPMQGPDGMAIHLAEADRPEGPWTSRGLLLAGHRYREFTRSWIGAGGPPLALGGDRFLAVYHMGHYTPEGRREYDLAAALLDFGPEAPHPVVSRIEPLMRPTGRAEQAGDPELGVDNVLFTCANYRWKDRLVIPYAGADSRIFGATVPFDALVAALEGPLSAWKLTSSASSF